MDDFKGKLNSDIARYRVHARHNYFASYACYLVAIAASLLTTILAASTDYLSKGTLAFLSAVPGTALLVNSVLSLEAKTRWYWKKARKYDGILMSLSHENLPLAEASKEKRTFDEEMEKEYPKFGMLPQKP